MNIKNNNIYYMYMTNRWIEFVKKWSSDNNTTYGCALTKPEMKAEYHKMYPKKVKLPKGVAKLEESKPPEDVKSKVTYPNLKIRIPPPQEENIRFEIEEQVKPKRGRTQKYMTAEEQYKAKLESNKQKRREKAAAKAAKKVPVLTETVEAKDKRKENERGRIMKALYKSITNLTDEGRSLSDALLTIFPNIQLTIQKLHSLPQLMKDGKHTGKLLLFSSPSIENIGWFMDYVNQILRGNFNGINRKIYEATYDYLNVPVGVRERRMFEMGEEDTRSRSKREYLNPPFDKFYIGEEVNHYGKRANVVKQTKTGISLRPKDGGKTFIVKDNDDLTKIIEGTGEI